MTTNDALLPLPTAPAGLILRVGVSRMGEGGGEGKNVLCGMKTFDFPMIFGNYAAMEPRRRNPDALLRRFARKMRREPSDGEKSLWELLRDRRLGGFKFRRQVPIANYIADFYCETGSLVVEVDGEQHTTPEALEYDRRREDAFGRLSIRTVRFSIFDVVRDPIAVARTILRILTTGS